MENQIEFGPLESVLQDSFFLVNAVLFQYANCFRVQFDDTYAGLCFRRGHAWICVKRVDKRFVDAECTFDQVNIIPSERKRFANPEASSGQKRKKRPVVPGVLVFCVFHWYAGGQETIKLLNRKKFDFTSILAFVFGN